MEKKCVTVLMTHEELVIANAIKESRNIEIDRKKIHLNDDSIKELGNYKAKIKLHKEVSATIQLDVVSE